MIFDIFPSIKAVIKLRNYRPQPVTLKTIDTWLNQFDKTDRKHLLLLLKHVIYVDEKETKKRLINQNRVLFDRLKKVGLGPQNIVYVQIDEAGSSSSLMLNILKESELLERRGCKFSDCHDLLNLNKITGDLGEGAIVYIDDFVGTGNQFCASRDFAIKHVVGSFSEFLIAPSICEEALGELGKRGIDSLSEHVHIRGQRPLHSNCTIFKKPIKSKLIELCLQIDKKGGLGYRDLASMVVFYRNASNGVPMILRGSFGQMEYKGVLPRIQDFFPPPD